MPLCQYKISIIKYSGAKLDVTLVVNCSMQIHRFVAGMVAKWSERLIIVNCRVPVLH